MKTDSRLQHLEFVNVLFSNGFNGTEAYKTVYGVESDNVAAACSSRLLRNAKIQKEIKERFASRAMGAEEALDILASHARGDVGDFFADDSLGLEFDLRKAKAAKKTKLIKRIKQRTIYTKDDQEIHEWEIELHDPQAAADKILKVLGKLSPDERNTQLTIKVEYGNNNNLTQST